MHQSVADRFLNEVSLVRQSTDAFDDFLNKRVPEIVSKLHTICCSHTTATETKTMDISFRGLTKKQPVSLEADGDCRPIYPQECRLRGLTYAVPIYTDVHVKRNDQLESIIRDVYIGRVPIMVFSSQCYLHNPALRVQHGECPHDEGGYFIVNGGEKCIVSQKGAMPNRIVSYNKNNVHYVAVKSENNRRLYVTTITHKPNAPVMCTFPRLQREVPVMDVLIALGADVNDIRDAFTPDERHVLNDSFKNLPSDMEEAMRRIQIREVYSVGASHEERVRNAFKHVMIPHVKPDEKITFFVLMMKELVAVAQGTVEVTDRDSVIHQRVESCCELLSALFHQLIIKLSNDVRTICQKSLARLKRGVPDEKIQHYISSTNAITDGMSYGLSTGNWNTSYINRQTRVGVSQQLQRLSILSTISQLKRVSSSMDSSQKLAKPRYVHGTHFGSYCLYETPEGQTVGLETQQTVQALISLKSEHNIVENVVKQFLSPLSIKNINAGAPVFINGRYIGNTMDETTVLETVRKLRRTNQAAKDIATSLNKRGAIHISTTSGRMCRPLMIVKDGKLMYTKEHEHMAWYGLNAIGVVEYIDKEEEDTMLVAFHPNDITNDHTHCEISTAMILGLSASCIPFSHHNPATRNCYQSAMGKQSQGVPCMNYQTRYDTTQNILQYGQKPLVSTKISDAYGVHDCPAGQNFVVAIMCFEGYNQEDSVLINQYSLDRGLARSDKYKTTAETLTAAKEKATFGQPTRKKRFGSYDKLDVDGFVNPGCEVSPKDCIIGKQVNRTTVTPAVGAVQTSTMEDASILSAIDGRVDNVLMYQQRNGDRAVKIKTRTSRVPVIGDKFSKLVGIPIHIPQSSNIALLILQVVVTVRKARLE